MSAEVGTRALAMIDAAQALRRTFARFHRIFAEAAGSDVALSDAMVLHHLAHVDDATPGQLAALTGLTSGGTTAVLDRLERQGWLERTRSGQDRRVVIISLRPEATPRLTGVMMKVHADLDKMFDGWGLQRIHDLVHVLDPQDAVPMAPKDPPLPR